MKAYTESTTDVLDKDEQETPPEVFARIQQVLRLEFWVDVCASEHNRKCAHYWTKEMDAFSFEWAEQTRARDGVICCLWMNPPYSMLPEFTAKAADEARRGCIVVGLVPHMCSSRWYQQFVHDVASSVYLPDGRISFLLNGEKRSGNPLPSCFPVWTPWQGRTSYNFFGRKA